MELFEFPLNWNHLQVYGLILVLQLAGILFTVGITLFISSLARSPMSALALSLGCYLLPQLLLQVFNSGLLNRLLYLFPITHLDIRKALLILSSKGTFFLPSFMQNTILIITVLLLGRGISNFLCFKHMKAWRFN
jgi:hypothetical protein